MAPSSICERDSGNHDQITLADCVNLYCGFTFGTFDMPVLGFSGAKRYLIDGYS